MRKKKQQASSYLDVTVEEIIEFYKHMTPEQLEQEIAMDKEWDEWLAEASAKVREQWRKDRDESSISSNN